MRSRGASSRRAWQITYAAPARYDFERDLATFDSAVASMRIW